MVMPPKNKKVQRQFETSPGQEILIIEAN